MRHIFITFLAAGLLWSPFAEAFSQPLQTGSQGEGVSRLQSLLSDTGHYTFSEITGYFGDITAAAVQRFQCEKNIVCSGTSDSTGFGIVGPLTSAALMAIPSAQALVRSSTDSTKTQQLLELLGQLRDRLTALKQQLADRKAEKSSTEGSNADTEEAESTIQQAETEPLPVDEADDTNDEPSGVNDEPQPEDDSETFDVSSINVTISGQATPISNTVIKEATKGGNIDSSMSRFSVNGENYWILPSAYLEAGSAYVFHTLTKGTLSRPAQEPLDMIAQWDLFSGSGTGLKWITNTYQDADGILGFVHAEYTEVGENFGKVRAPGHSKIGLSWYDNPNPRDREPDFEYLGHIGAPYNEDAGSWNVHGTPYIIVEEDGQEWFYAYFHDRNDTSTGWGHIAAMRAPVDDVLRAAKSGNNVVWRKYYNGQWAESGLRGKSTAVLNGPLIASADAVRSTETGTYYFAGTVFNDWFNSTDPSAIILFASKDGVNWEEVHRFAQDSNVVLGWNYPTIVDTDGSDNGEFDGDSFYIYSVYESNQKDVTNVKRFTVTVSE